MSSNVEEPEESNQSPADSADASEHSPSPVKATPPPPPKGSYAAVDRDVLYTVRFFTAISTTHDSYTDPDTVLRQWRKRGGAPVEICSTQNARYGCIWLGNRSCPNKQNNVHVSSGSTS